jgi:hypothetical protein
MDNSLVPIIKELERVYDYLAKEFNLTADRPVLTVQTRSRQKNTLGWFWHDKWNLDKKDIPEINICAENLNKNPIETLVHEMVHYSLHVEKVDDCNAQGYHNKHFKARAELYGLNVEKSGRHGWAFTSISPKLEDLLKKIEINYETFKMVRNITSTTVAPTKMKKWTCDCTTVRCATDLKAKCNSCGKDFNEEE